MPEIQKLLQATGADRSLRAYAYLTTALREQPGTKDVLDCLIPFLRAGVEQQPVGAELDIPRLRLFLQSLGLDVPEFVLMELRRRLNDIGAVEWKAGSYFVKRVASNAAPSAQVTELDLAFETLEQQISEFAAERFAMQAAPFSETWSDALIAFLRSATATSSAAHGVAAGNKAPLLLDNTLLGDPASAERMVVVRFVEECEENPSRSAAFGNILTVFTGVLIEDFIANVQTIADKTRHRGLCIYYDTTVLLRMLGTSGQLLRLATLDMHTALHELGWKTLYLPPTQREVWRILQGIAESPLTAHPETAEAYVNGDFTRDDVADLPDTFVARLRDDFGILPAEPEPVARKSWQLEESRLSEMLVAASDTYKAQSAKMDASAVASILRLRKGQTANEIGLCQHLFISRNSLLQRITRDFVNNNVADYEPGIIPPVLTVGQIATVAWLSTSQDLEPTKVTRELLVNCYSAIRPSAEWIGKFARVFEDVTSKRPESVANIANSAIFLRTTRTMMQDASLNRPVLIESPKLDGIIDNARSRSEKAGFSRRIAEGRIKQLEAELELARGQANAARQVSTEAQEHAERAVAEAKAVFERTLETEREARRVAMEQQAAKPELPVVPTTPVPNQQADVARLIGFVIVVALALGSLVLLRDHIAVALIALCVVVMLPPLLAYIFNANQLVGQQMVDIYKIGLGSVGIISRLLVHAPAVPGAATDTAEPADLDPPTASPPDQKRKRAPSAPKRVRGVGA